MSSPPGLGKKRRTLTPSGQSPSGTRAGGNRRWLSRPEPAAGVTHTRGARSGSARGRKGRRCPCPAGGPGAEAGAAGQPGLPADGVRGCWKEPAGRALPTEATCNEGPRAGKGGRRALLPGGPGSAPPGHGQARPLPPGSPQTRPSRCRAAPPGSQAIPVVSPAVPPPYPPPAAGSARPASWRRRRSRGRRRVPPVFAASGHTSERRRRAARAERRPLAGGGGAEHSETTWLHLSMFY